MSQKKCFPGCTCKKHVGPWTGKKRSQETKEKLRNARAQQPPTFLGKHHSEETRARISIALTGRIHPEDCNCRIHDSSSHKYGEDHPNWTDEPTYDTIHRRISSERGPASVHACIDCGGQAEHWSYAYTDPNSLISKKGPYSTDHTHYDPRCSSCHKKFDISQKRSLL